MSHDFYLGMATMSFVSLALFKLEDLFRKKNDLDRIERAYKGIAKGLRDQGITTFIVKETTKD